MIAGVVMAVARLLVAAAAAWTGVVALTHWAVRRGHLAPFGAWPRAVRASSDPILQPVERRLLRSGGNPQQAPLWLFLAVLVGGLVLLSVLEWFIGALFRVGWAVQSGPGALAILAVHTAYAVLVAALVVRVLGSWFGLGPERRWMRVASALTEWLVRPIRRLLPTMGPFDLSPLVAWVALLLLRGLLLGLLR